MNVCYEGTMLISFGMGYTMERRRDNLRTERVRDLSDLLLAGQILQASVGGRELMIAIAALSHIIEMRGGAFSRDIAVVESVQDEGLRRF